MYRFLVPGWSAKPLNSAPTTELWALTATTVPETCAPHRYSPTRSVRCLRFSLSRKTWPSLSGRQVLLFHASACDELTHLYTGHRRGHIQAAPRLDHPQIPVDAIGRFLRWFTHGLLSANTVPAALVTAQPAVVWNLRRRPRRTFMAQHGSWDARETRPWSLTCRYAGRC